VSRPPPPRKPSSNAASIRRRLRVEGDKRRKVDDAERILNIGRIVPVADGTLQRKRVDIVPDGVVEAFAAPGKVATQRLDMTADVGVAATRGSR
jgi:hypothetical protein